MLRGGPPPRVAATAEGRDRVITQFDAAAISHARLLRNRYTLLDLAGDAGLLAAFAAGEAERGRY